MPQMSTEPRMYTRYLYHYSTRDLDWDDTFWEYVEWLKNNTQGMDYGEVLYLEEEVGEMNVGFSRENPDAVLKTMDEVLKCGYIKPGVLKLRALANYHLFNYGLALQDIDKAIETAEDTDALVEYITFKAQVLIKMGKYQEAFATLAHARNLSKTISADEFRGLWDSITYGIEEEILWRFGLALKFDTTGGKYEKNIEKNAQIIVSAILAERARHRYIHLITGGREEVDGKTEFRQRYAAIYASLIDLVGSEFWANCGNSYHVLFEWEKS